MKSLYTGLRTTSLVRYVVLFSMFFIDLIKQKTVGHLCEVSGCKNKLPRFFPAFRTRPGDVSFANCCAAVQEETKFRAYLPIHMLCSLIPGENKTGLFTIGKIRSRIEFDSSI